MIRARLKSEREREKPRGERIRHIHCTIGSAYTSLHDRKRWITSVYIEKIRYNGVRTKVVTYSVIYLVLIF